MKKTYTKHELTELAKGVFKDDKESPSIYANEEGTFLNPKQYAKLSDEKKKSFRFEFKNPAAKTAELPSAGDDRIEQLEAELESAQEERDAALSLAESRGKDLEDAGTKIKDLEYDLKTASEAAANGSAKVSELQALLDETNAELATLKAKLAGPPALATEPKSKPSGRTPKAPK